MVWKILNLNWRLPFAVNLILNLYVTSLNKQKGILNTRKMNILHLALCPIVHIIVCENSGHSATQPLLSPRLRNHCRNSILMTRHYPNLGCTGFWLVENLLHSIRSTTQIWILRRHVTRTVRCFPRLTYHSSLKQPKSGKYVAEVYRIKVHVINN